MSDDRMNNRKQYNQLFQGLKKILNEEDPVGLMKAGDPDDGYEPEVSGIIPQIARCTTLDEYQDVIHKEFATWFGSDKAGAPDDYAFIAKRVKNLNDTLTRNL